MNIFSISAIISRLGFSRKQPQSASENIWKFEAILKSCKLSEDYMPAWESFVNTNFYIAIIRHDSDVKTKDFQFIVNKNPQGHAKHCVIISEKLERLENPQSSEAIKLTGAKLIELLKS